MKMEYSKILQVYITIHIGIHIISVHENNTVYIMGLETKGSISGISCHVVNVRFSDFPRVVRQRVNKLDCSMIHICSYNITQIFRFFYLMFYIRVSSSVKILII